MRFARRHLIGVLALHYSIGTTDIVKFIEEVVHMKVPEPPRPTPPGNKTASSESSTTSRKAITSRAALPIRSRKRPADEPSPEEVDGVTVVNKCGRCRTISDSDTGCVQCRRAQLVINMSREGIDLSENSDNGGSNGTEASSSNPPPLLNVQTTMLGRVQMKEFTPSMQTEGDEAIANHIAHQRWTPFAIMPPHKIHAPFHDPSVRKADKQVESPGKENEDALDSTEEEDSSQSESSEADTSLKGSNSHGVDSAAKKEILESTHTSKMQGASVTMPPPFKRSRISARSSARIVALENSANRRDDDMAAMEMDEKDRQVINRRYSKEKEELNKRCLSVACCGILLGMMRRDPLQLFAEPAEAEGYNKIIINPIDFGTMKKKLLSNTYTTLGQFVYDSQLLCDNALVYNPPESVYWKTAKEMSDLLQVMQKRATKWMSAIREAHSSAFSKASKAELMDMLEQLDKLPPNSFMIKDTFFELRQTWPQAIDMLKSHDRLRKQVESDFMRTKENETAYYGSIAIRRAAVAAAYSLAPYPDSSGIYNVVGRRSHIEDENLRNHVAEKVAQVVEPPQLKDLPTWREEMVMRVLRKSQSRRMEGMTESPSGCARCDGVRMDQELKTVAKSVRWGRFRKRVVDAARVDKSRLNLSTGLGSQLMQERIRKQREDTSYDHKDLQEGRKEALLSALERMEDIAVSVRPSRVHGMGLFADQPFRKGDVVAEYIGEYVSPAVTDARERIYRDERIQDYQFRVGSDLIIDATKVRRICVMLWGAAIVLKR
jgi:Bromodomain